MTDVIQVSVRWDRRTSVWSVARSTAATIASRRVRIINDGGGGWHVRCDEAWGEGNGTDDWTTPPMQCILQTCATATDTAVVCQTKHCHRPSCKFLPP